MGISKNRGTTKSSILIGFSIINHPFWGTPIFGNTHIRGVLYMQNPGWFPEGPEMVGFFWPQDSRLQICPPKHVWKQSAMEGGGTRVWRFDSGPNLQPWDWIISTISEVLCSVLSLIMAGLDFVMKVCGLRGVEIWSEKRYWDSVGGR